MHNFTKLQVDLEMMHKQILLKLISDNYLDFAIALYANFIGAELFGAEMGRK